MWSLEVGGWGALPHLGYSMWTGSAAGGVGEDCGGHSSWSPPSVAWPFSEPHDPPWETLIALLVSFFLFCD